MARICMDYRRHFILLPSITVLGLTDRWWKLGVIPAIGVYGALHSAAIVIALRTAPARWLKVSFILIAGCLAMSSASIARSVGHSLATTLGLGLPTALLAVSSGLGAASYGLLIKYFWIRRLSPRSLAWITLCCLLSTLAARPLGVHLHAGEGWFAIIWWWTFSLALWYHCRGVDGSEDSHVRHP